MGGNKKRKNKLRHKSQPPAPKANTVSSTKTPHPLVRLIKSAGAILTILVTISAILQLIQQPSVETPSPIEPDSFFAPFEITNESFLPLFSLKATCDPHITGLNDNAVFRNVTIFGLPPRTVMGRQKVTARCDSIIRLRGPIKSASVTLTLSYHHFLWPFTRKSDYEFIGIVRDGKLARWIAK
jgi:hypothetical protein